jgi:hypothetical protein
MMNVISILFSSFGIAGVYLASEDLVPVDDWLDMAQNAFVQDLDDDDLQTDVHYLVDNLAWVLYAFLGVCIVFATIGIVGAVSYRPGMVLSCAMWYLIQGIASLVLMGWGGLGILLAGIWVYPNIMLYQEQVEGVMSKENYVNEIYSCCCLSTATTTTTTTTKTTSKRNRNRKPVMDVRENRLGVYA